MDKDNSNDPIGMEPLDEKTAKNLSEAMERMEQEQESKGKINYRGYMGNQTPAQSQVPIIDPKMPKLQSYQRFERHEPSPKPEPEFTFPKVPAIKNNEPATQNEPIMETPLAMASGLMDTIKKTQSLPKPETEQERKRREILSNLFTYNPNFIPPPAILRLNGERFGTAEGLSLIGGKPKSGKTSLMVAAIVSFLKQKYVCGWEGMPPDGRPEVVWIDTEQSEGDLQTVVGRIQRACNASEFQNLHIYHLRDYRGAELISALYTIIQAHPRASLMLLDHAGDSCLNSNDPTETRSNVNSLHQIAIQHRIHLMLITHMNKSTHHEGKFENNSSGFEGWLGKEIQKKAETVVAVFKTDTAGIRRVVCTDARGKEIPDFEFRIDSEHELPELLQTRMGRYSGEHTPKLSLQPFTVDKTVHAESVAMVFSDGQALTLRELEPRIKNELNQRTGKACSDAMAAQWRAHWVSVGVMIQEGTAGTRSCRYRPADPDWVLVPMTAPTPEIVDTMAAELPMTPPPPKTPKPESKSKRSKQKT